MGAARFAAVVAGRQDREAEQAYPAVFARIRNRHSSREQELVQAKAEIDSLKEQLITARTGHVEHVRQLKEQFSADYHTLEQKLTSVQQELISAQEQIKALRSTNEGLMGKLECQREAIYSADSGRTNEPARTGPG